jgi:hypothetical protein
MIETTFFIIVGFLRAVNRQNAEILIYIPDSLEISVFFSVSLDFS